MLDKCRPSAKAPILNHKMHTISGSERLQGIECFGAPKGELGTLALEAQKLRLTGERLTNLISIDIIIH